MNESERNIEWLQALRGIAALLVTFVHARYFLHDTPSWSLANTLFYSGAMGVDLFFIVSGFIMVHATRSSDGSAIYAFQFIAKRIARVWPPYIVITLLFLYLDSGWLYFQDEKLRSATIKSLMFIPVNSLTPPYFDNVLPQGWTLSFEVYFYLIFALSLLFSRWRWVALFSYAFVSLLIVPYFQGHLSLNVFHVSGYRTSYFELATNPIIWDFFAGICIGLLYHVKLDLSKFKLVLTLVSVAASGFAMWAIYSGYCDIHGMGSWGWPLAIVVLALALRSRAADIPVPRVMIWLGTISYSLYLVHVLPQHLIPIWLEAKGLGAWVHTWSFIFLTTALSLVLASVSHYLLEERLSGAIRRALLGLPKWLNFERKR